MFVRPQSIFIIIYMSPEAKLNVLPEVSYFKMFILSNISFEKF